MENGIAHVRNFKGKSKGAQEAHEAITADRYYESITVAWNGTRPNCMSLIWKRTIASQMSDAQLERTNVKIKASTHTDEFTANGEVIKFDGFLKVYMEGTR